MKIWVGITDSSWFKQLKELAPEEVNFWQPGGTTSFKVLPDEGLFLFKLHHPENYIVGGGYFARHSSLPVSLAWKAFGQKNGVQNFEEFLNRIRRYRRGEAGHDPVIGNIILTQPFFLDRQDWIPVPDSFKKNIVTGKSYDSESEEGRMLVAAIQHRVMRFASIASDDIQPQEEQPRFGNPMMVRPRLGQGAFRVAVTDVYQRRCALTGEKTLPVLEAAHIQPYSAEDPHQVQNGLLLRSDLHILFDQGYVTVTPDHHVLVSKRIREEFQNGRHYYALDGQKVANLPAQAVDRPSGEFLSWHNQNTYLG